MSRRHHQPPRPAAPAKPHEDFAAPLVAEDESAPKEATLPAEPLPIDREPQPGGPVLVSDLEGLAPDETTEEAPDAPPAVDTAPPEPSEDPEARRTRLLRLGIGSAAPVTPPVHAVFDSSSEAKRNGYSRARVLDTVSSRGRMYEPGDEAWFLDTDIASAPHCFEIL